MKFQFMPKIQSFCLFSRSLLHLQKQKARTLALQTHELNVNQSISPDMKTVCLEVLTQLCGIATHIVPVI